MTNEDILMRCILKEVVKERKRQDNKWGEQNHHPFKWLAIIAEEFGEASKAVLESRMISSDNSYREELIETAASCIAAVESLDRSIT